MPDRSLGQKWGGDTPGDRIRQARIIKGMTITDLSSLTGLAAVSISNIEKNRRTASIPTLSKLTKALDVPAPFIGCFEKLPEASIAEKIKKARYYHCLTREEMANRIGVNPRTIFD